MIIKVATARDDEGNIQWTHLYSKAIRNRLRRDKNLADLTDPAAARKNLGVESNIDLVVTELREELKRYVDQQDIYYDTSIRQYINVNIIGDSAEHGTLSLHHQQIQNILDQLSSQVGPDIDGRFNELWAEKVRSLKNEIESMIDNKLRNYATISYVQQMVTGMATTSWVIDQITSSVIAGMTEANRLNTSYSKLDQQKDLHYIEVNTNNQLITIGDAFTYLMGNFTLKQETAMRDNFMSDQIFGTIEDHLLKSGFVKKTS